MKVTIVSKVLTCLSDDIPGNTGAKKYDIVLSEQFYNEQAPLNIRYCFTAGDPLTVNEMYQVTANVHNVIFDRALDDVDDDLMRMYGRIVSAKLLATGD